MNLNVSRDGAEIGTWSEEEVRTLYTEGQLLPTDSYWHEGMTEWKQLFTLHPAIVNSVARLAAEEKQCIQPPVPTGTPSDPAAILSDQSVKQQESKRPMTNEQREDAETTRRVMVRYSGVYITARLSIIIGYILFAWGIGAIVLLNTIFSHANSSNDVRGFIAVFAMSVGATSPFFLSGFLCIVIGQMLKAFVDIAVHTSPFMSAMEKAIVMEVG